MIAAPLNAKLIFNVQYLSVSPKTTDIVLILYILIIASALKAKLVYIA